MTYTMEQFAADIRDALRADQGSAGKLKVSQLVSRSLNDPELGCCICGHVYDGVANGSPHDHGSSWAIYGQAVGVTEMTDWKIVEKGEAGEPALVEPDRTYVMKPGDAHLYDVADVHSPRRAVPVKLIRIEGRNLDHVKRSNIKAASSATAP